MTENRARVWTRICWFLVHCLSRRTTVEAERKLSCVYLSGSVLETLKSSLLLFPGHREVKWLVKGSTVELRLKPRSTWLESPIFSPLAIFSYSSHQVHSWSPPGSPSTLETRLAMAPRDSRTAVEAATWVIATVLIIDRYIQTTLQSWDVLAKNMAVHGHSLDHQASFWLPRFLIPDSRKTEGNGNLYETGSMEPFMAQHKLRVYEDLLWKSQSRKTWRKMKEELSLNLFIYFLFE